MLSRFVFDSWTIEFEREIDEPSSLVDLVFVISELDDVSPRFVVDEKVVDSDFVFSDEVSDF